MTMLPLLLTTRAAPTVPSTCTDPDIVPTMRSESGAQRTCRFLLPAVTRHRAVGLGDEAAAFDRELGTGLGHDPDAAALADDP